MVKSELDIWVRDRLQLMETGELEPTQTGDKIWVYCKVTECWYKVHILDTYYEKKRI
jgi:hypothetical protein